MGLDCYLIAVPEHPNNPEVVDVSKKDINYPFIYRESPEGMLSTPYSEQKCYWRKNWFIEKFFECLYRKKAEKNNIDVDINFNCCYVQVTIEDIEELIHEVANDDMDDWRDTTIEDTKDHTIDQLYDLLKFMQSTAGKRCQYYFSPWW